MEKTSSILSLRDFLLCILQLQIKLSSVILLFLLKFAFIFLKMHLLTIGFPVWNKMEYTHLSLLLSAVQLRNLEVTQQTINYKRTLKYGKTAD